jgi:hypothetical protein
MRQFDPGLGRLLTVAILVVRIIVDGDARRFGRPPQFDGLQIRALPTSQRALAAEQWRNAA